MLVLDATNTNTTDGPTTSVTVSHTIGAGINTCLFVVAVIKTGTPSPTATYNSVAMTKIGEINDTVETIAAFYMINPPTGAHDVTVTWTGNGSAKLLAISYFGVHLGVPFYPGSLTTALTPNGSISVPSMGNDIVLDCIGYSTNYASGCTPGAGQTLLLDHQSAASALHGAASSKPADVGTTTTMTWTAPTSAGSHLGFSIHAAGKRGGVAVSPTMIF